MTLPIPMVLSAKRPSGSTSPTAIRVLSAGALILGAVLLGRAWWTNDLAQRSRDWPTTTGTVMHSRAERQNRKGEAKYTPLVHYSYEVAGSRYESERRALSSLKTSKTKAEAICQDYPPGKTVTVYYDPAKPGEALLMPGQSHETLPLAIVGAVLLGLSGFFFTRSLQAGNSVASL